MNENNQGGAEKVFASGFIFKVPRAGAPEFVKGSISVKIDEAIAFLQQNADNGWVNIDLKVSQQGKAYAELNTWKPQSNAGQGGYAAPPPPPVQGQPSQPFQTYQAPSNPGQQPGLAQQGQQQYQAPPVQQQQPAQQQYQAPPAAQQAYPEDDIPF